MTTHKRRQFDHGSGEYYCTACHKRWNHDEDEPECTPGAGYTAAMVALNKVKNSERKAKHYRRS